MEKKLRKICVRYYNLLIAQDLWQAHYHMLSLSNNLSEGVHRIKCKFGHDDKNVKLVELSI